MPYSDLSTPLQPETYAEGLNGQGSLLRPSTPTVEIFWENARAWNCRALVLGLSGLRDFGLQGFGMRLRWVWGSTSEFLLGSNFSHQNP